VKFVLGFFGCFLISVFFDSCLDACAHEETKDDGSYHSLSSSPLRESFSERNCQVVFRDNEELTKSKVDVRHLYDKVRAEHRSAFGLEPKVGIYDVDPSYSVIQIKSHYVKRGSSDSIDVEAGTGFFVMDQRKTVGGCHPFNVRLLDLDPKFPKPFLITNRHVLNHDDEEKITGCCLCSTVWDKYYSFYFHIVKGGILETNPAEPLISMKRGDFKQAILFVKSKVLDIHYLPNVLLGSSSVELDISAIDLDPVFTFIKSKIDLEHSGYLPYYSAFDLTKERVRHTTCKPLEEQSFFTYGFSRGAALAGKLPDRADGTVTSVIGAEKKISGKKKFLDGSCTVDFPGGASGSPLCVNVEPNMQTPSVLLMGVGFAGAEGTDRKGAFISADRVRSLIEGI
jgi:hypothetical protein